MAAISKMRIAPAQFTVVLHAIRGAVPSRFWNLATSVRAQSSAASEITGTNVAQYCRDISRYSGRYPLS